MDLIPLIVLPLICLLVVVLFIFISVHESKIAKERMAIAEATYNNTSIYDGDRLRPCPKCGNDDMSEYNLSGRFLYLSCKRCGCRKRFRPMNDVK